MRKKTEECRQRIIENAGTVFRERGFERTSMAEIATRMCGSKATLYDYFGSKQELFTAVMLQSVEGQAEFLTALIEPDTDDPRGALIGFGRAYLAFVLSADALSLIRVSIAEGGTSEFGNAMYAAGPGRGWMRVGKQLEIWVERGLLRPCPPCMLALYLRGLLEAGLVEPALYGATVSRTPEDCVEQAVDAFLRAFATDRGNAAANHANLG